MNIHRRNISDRYLRARPDLLSPRRWTTEEVGSGQAEILQQRYKEAKDPPKALSADSGTCWRAAKNHLSGATNMNLKDFFNACQVIPELQSWGARMMGLTPSIEPHFDAEMQALIRAYYAIKDREGEHV